MMKSASAAPNPDSKADTAPATANPAGIPTSHPALRPLQRPRIGLVLSGGGARDAAHILAFDSPLGPMFFAYGRAADGNQSGYLFLGKP